MVFDTRKEGKSNSKMVSMLALNIMGRLITNNKLSKADDNIARFVSNEIPYIGTYGSLNDNIVSRYF